MTMETAYSIVEIKKLKEHEEVNGKDLEVLKKKIATDRVFTTPIVVDKNTNVILDGHYRFNVLKALGCSKIPVIMVDYKAPEIKVLPWREGDNVTKDMVIKAAFTGKKLLPKTSKHMVEVDGKLEHIRAIQKPVAVPLDELK